MEELRKNIYFVGIGGIGMSALARHYKTMGCNVAGYDRTPSQLTSELEAEGIGVSYVDSLSAIPSEFRLHDDTLVVYTPAIPSDNAVLSYFREKEFKVVKRAYALGQLTKLGKALCVAGTHGKTTTSTLVAHILKSSSVGCSAFLGGISVNYSTNYWGDVLSPYVVTEADEYDRSFLQLTPYIAVITAMDADHLDIYGTVDEMRKAFLKFASQIVEGGTLVHKYGLPVPASAVGSGVSILTYSAEDSAADCYATNIRIEAERYVFDVVTKVGTVEGVRLGVPGRHNVENCVAAVAVALLSGVSVDDIRKACGTFRGDRRRFEMRIERPDVALIDDYAHHPQEILATLKSVRELFPGRKLTVAFQPHLYTRTRDLADGFAEVLSLADRTWLLDIYPARELPIKGVSSQMLLDRMKSGVGRLSTKETLAADITSEDFDIVVIMGAGDIDRLVTPVAERIKSVRHLLA